MKKMLTLVALTAGVALFAGCMNKPVEETTVEETPVVEETTTTEVTTDEVTPAVEETTTPDATTTTEVAPEATAE